MKTLLIIPPILDPTSPPLGLPCLASFLRSNGYPDTSLMDLNLKAYDYLLSAETTERICRKARTRFDRLNSRRYLNFRQQLEYNCLAHSLLRANLIPEMAGSIKTIFRSKRHFRDPRKYDLARQVLYLYLELISAVHHPTKLSVNDYSHRWQGDLTIDFLSGSIEDRETNVFYDFYRRSVMPEILGRKSPDLIGISVSAYAQLIPSLTLANLIRRHRKNVHICIGGSALYSMSDFFKSQKWIFSILDSVVLYEGEEALLSLVRSIELGRDFANIPNLIYSQKGVIRSNPLRPIKNIDELPTPDFEGLPLDDYFAPWIIFPLYMSRGCIWNKCTFCDHHKSYYGSYRVRNLNLVYRDIAKLVEKYGMRYFSFVDEVVPFSLLEGISRKIKQGRLNVLWWTNVRAEKKVSRDLFKTLYDGGCRILGLGMESAVGRVLKLMNKGIQVEDLKRFFTLAHQAKISIFVFIIKGFPSESCDEYLETLMFLKRHKAVGDTVVVHDFALKRFSPIYAAPHRFGIEKVFPRQDAISTSGRFEMGDEYPRPDAWPAREKVERLQRQIEGNQLARLGLIPQVAGLTPHAVQLYLYHDSDLRLRRTVPPEFRARKVPYTRKVDLLGKRIKAKRSISVLATRFSLGEVEKSADLLRQELKNSPSPDYPNRVLLYSKRPEYHIFPRPATAIHSPQADSTLIANSETVAFIKALDGKHELRKAIGSLEKRAGFPEAVDNNSVLRLVRKLLSAGFLEEA